MHTRKDGEDRKCELPSKNTLNALKEQGGIANNAFFCFIFVNDYQKTAAEGPLRLCSE
jgi:hypothetical protein